MAIGEVFGALSDPTRRQILRMLSRDDLSAEEIARAFSLSKPSISHRLGMLREAGLVLSRRQGQMIIYSLLTAVLQEALGWGLDILRASEARAEGGRSRWTIARAVTGSGASCGTTGPPTWSGWRCRQ